MKITKSNEIKNCDGMRIGAVKGMTVCQWHPLPDGKGLPTQVHILIDVEGLPVPLCIRFRSRVAVDAIVGALTEHANEVWPEEVQ